MGAPYPALLALAGAGLALVPRTPTLVLDPELALTLFVAPVLMDSAFDASLRDLRANWRSVAGLALGAVVFTCRDRGVPSSASWSLQMPWDGGDRAGGHRGPTRRSRRRPRCSSSSVRHTGSS